MNETLQTILSRRSVRKFDARQLSDEHLNALLDAGIYAPSGCNRQPWFFTVVQNRAFIAGLEEAVAKTKGRDSAHYHPFFSAPTVIFVSGNIESEWAETDCAAATQNMLLAAHALQLGGCWIGCCRSTLQGPDREVWKKKLRVPEGYTPFYGISFGYLPEGFEPSNPSARKQPVVAYLPSEA